MWLLDDSLVLFCIVQPVSPLGSCALLNALRPDYMPQAARINISTHVGISNGLISFCIKCDSLNVRIEEPRIGVV